jgi:type II secretory pathway pseudopilin PulG
MARSTTTRSSTGHALARLADDDGGFTLVEAMVAFALFTIMATTATFGLVQIIRATNTNKDRVAAANLATQEVERLRGQHNANQQLDSAAQTSSLHGTSFTVTPTLNPIATATCPDGTSRGVTVMVTWNGSGSHPVRYDTVLAC